MMSFLKGGFLMRRWRWVLPLVAIVSMVSGDVAADQSVYREELGIRVTMPDGWETTNTWKNSIPIWRADNVSIRADIMLLTGKGTAKEIVERRRAINQKDGLQSEVAPASLGGKAAISLAFTSENEKEVSIYADKAPDQVIVLSLEAPVNLFSSLQKDFDTVRESVQF